MHRRHFLAAALALGMTGMLSSCSGRLGTAETIDVRPGAGPTLPTDPPSGTFAALGDALLSQLAPRDTNLALSPWSIGVVLAMIRGGAVGATAEQLDSVLRVQPDRLAATVNTLWRAMAAVPKATLTGANAVWGDHSVTWKPAFTDYLTDFGAPLQARDIRSTPDTVTTEINRWVADQTKGKISDLLEPGLVNAMTRMVLVNALYFASSWARPLIASPERLPFTGPDGQRADAARLQGGGQWRWAEADGWTGAAIPCEAGDYAMVLVLPRKAGTPASTVATSAASKAVLTGGLHAVSLTAPKWRVENAFSLQDALGAVGVRLPFDADRAEFGGMSETEKLFVGFLKHKAVVAVDEKGVEAAAATAAGMEATGMPSETKTLTLDRPFGWSIVHTPTLTPLFQGVLASPPRA